MLMARGRRSKVVDLTHHDTPFGAIVTYVEVDDPYPTPGVQTRIRVTANVRHDPIREMHARRQVSDEQFMAARHWQRLYEQAEISNLRGIDTTADKVDCRMFHDFFTNKRQRAVDELGRLAFELKQDGSAIIWDFLGKNMFLNQIAEMRGFSDEKYLRKRLRECLDTLAEELGYTVRRW